MEMRTATTLVVLAVAAALLGGGPGRAGAAEIEGVRFTERYQAGDAVLDLNCVALLRYMVLIKAYVAALYLGERVDPERAMDDVPKRLEIHYFHAIKAEDFARVGDEVVANNVGPARFEALRPRLERLGALYEDVRPGDRYALTYLPGRGTELALNGRPKGLIEGADFAAAVFAIWLGPKPLDVSLKSALLTCS